MFDVGCSMFDVRCWTVVAARWLLKVGVSHRCCRFQVTVSSVCILTSHSALRTPHSEFRRPRQYSALRTPHSALRIPNSDVQRAPYADPRLLHDMGINLGGRNIFVSEQLLNGPDVIAGFQKARGETVTQRMATGGLRYTSQAYRLFQRPLQTGLAGVVTAHSSRPWISA